MCHVKKFGPFNWGQWGPMGGFIFRAEGCLSEKANLRAVWGRVGGADRGEDQ